MREVIHRGLISSKKDLLDKTKLAYQVTESKSIADFHQISRDVDWMADEGLLARAAYGVYARGIEHELIPNKNQAFFIPIFTDQPQNYPQKKGIGILFNRADLIPLKNMRKS